MSSQLDRAQATFALDRTEFTYEAMVKVGPHLACWAVGYFDEGKVAVLQIKTEREFRRCGLGRRLLRELRSAVGGPVYPVRVTDTVEAKEFWIQWYMEQEKVDRERATQMALVEHQVRSL
jgi:hypothetical protein